MKKIINILAVLTVVASFASCSHVSKYRSDNIVAFGNTKYEIGESAGAYKIRVVAYPENGNPNTTVSFKVVEGTAKAGTNFTIEPASGVLTFAGDSTQYITVNVIDNDGVFTGDVNFSIEIESATNNYYFTNTGKAFVNIKDEDHPLLDLFGEYTMKGISNSSSGYGYYTWTLNISAYEGDVTKVWMDVTAPFFDSNFYGSYAPHAEVFADVSEDMSTITIPCPQNVVSTANDAFGVDEPFTLYKYDGNNLDANFITTADTIVFTLQDDGSYVTTDNYGFATKSYVGDGWFYYYMNVFGGFNSSYPAFFVKN